VTDLVSHDLIGSKILMIRSYEYLITDNVASHRLYFTALVLNKKIISGE
jgi:hypothetical protein